MILIDAHGLIFQVYHAIRDRMSGPSGVPTNALFGFVRDLFYLRDQKPDYLVCAFDASERTFRNDLYSAYKANRDPMPEDLRLQIPLIHDALDALSIPVIQLAGFEADDILATVAKKAAQRGLHVWICTSDKDCRQLIDDTVQLYNLRKKKAFGRKELEDDWGITPEQVVDLQTLVGDSVDNVPGVPGIGVKTAAKLLQEHGTVENLLNNIDKVAGKKRKENLEAAKGNVELTKKLVRLEDAVPIEEDWENWKLRPWKQDRLAELLQEWGFRSMLNRVRNEAAPPGHQQGSLFTDQDEELFPFGANADEDKASAPAKPWKGEYHLVEIEEKLADFLKELKKQLRFAVDLETTGLEPLQCEIVGYAITWRAEEAWYLPVRGPEGEATLDPDKTLAAVRPILEDASITKVNQNIKYDWLVLRAHGVRMEGMVGDPMVAHYLLHSGARSHSLDDLSQEVLKHSMIPITDLIGKKSRKQPQLTMDQVPVERVRDYAGEDADVAWRLTESLEAELKGSPLEGLYRELEVPLIEVLAELEYVGIRLDQTLLQKLSEEMGGQLEAIEQEIYELAGREFKIGSLVQLRKILFEELNLPVQKKTGTGAASTDQETLEALAAMTHLEGHKLPKKIVEHRQVGKLKSTYVDALPKLMNPETGRVHTSFNQTVASTGRLSSSDPNLQNIPVRREMGQQIRQAFLPEAGWQLLTADYSQIELRLLAHFCEDEELRRAFIEDRDIHTSVAREIFKVEEKDVTSEMRRMAKTVNFGVVYGMSPHGLSTRLGIPREEAAEFIKAYFERYPRVLKYQEELLADCRKLGYVSTILGRRRKIEGIRPVTTYQQRSQPEREAINMEVQGSAADLIKSAMLGLHRRITKEKLKSRMLLQIHDELIFEMPPEEAEILPGLVREEMTAPVEKQLKLEVPLKVDIAVGPNWLDTEPIKSASPPR